MPKEEGLTLSFNEEGEARIKQVGPYEPVCPGDNGTCDLFTYIKKENHYLVHCMKADTSPFSLDVCPLGRWWKTGHMPVPEMIIIPATATR